jgi:glucose/arabinose dehydrogenase
VDLQGAGRATSLVLTLLGPHPDPEYGRRRADLVRATKLPDIHFEAHSAPLGLAFYNAAQFPVRYRGGAFVALHGSWNTSRPTGYKVVFVPFKNARPIGGYENFATGFWLRGVYTPEIIGRPVGLAIAADGSLLIADDAANVIWRVAYSP